MNIFTLILAGTVLCHSNMLEPPIRGSLAPYWGYCSPSEGCPGPCESPYVNNPYTESRRKTLQRDQTIPIKWLRQNHPGGFVRLAIAQTRYSNLHEAFDSSIIKYTCFESGCSEDGEHPFHGYKNGPNIPGESPNHNCATSMKIPGDLKDGAYTIQWTWFAGGVNNGNNQAPFGTYYSCSDIIIKGGPESQREPQLFEGGDAAIMRNDQCRYWGSADPRSCFHGKSAICPYGPPKVGAPRDYLVSKNPNTSLPVDAYFVPPSSWKDPPGQWIPPPDYVWTPPPGYDPVKDKSNFGSVKN